MTTPWTPGPWEWWTSNSFRRLSSAVTRRDGDVLCAVVQRSDGHPDVLLRNGGWDGPDGRLIAAAPELAKALEMLEDAASCIVATFERIPEDYPERRAIHTHEGHTEAYLREQIDAARALLARIKGEDAP